jgi:methionyl-tRNA formyltransferase
MRALRIVYFGTPDFAVPGLRALIESPHEVAGLVSQPDRPRGRGQKHHPTPTKLIAEAAGIPVLQPMRLKEDAFADALGSLSPDLGVVAAYGRIIPDRILEIPRLGMINIHASLLPKYRGASPIHRALQNGDAETGVTIMRVVRALDAGPMLAATRVPIGGDDRTDQVEAVLAGKGGALLVDTVDRLASGPVTEVPQDETLATYAPRLTKDSGIVDWSRPARAIHNQVRALHPWPHAFTFGPGGRLILHRSRVADPDAAVAASPGAVLPAVDPDAVRVATGDGILELLDLQAEGGRILPARLFQAGHPLAPGARLRSS